MRLLTAAIGHVESVAFGPAGDALAATVERQGVYLWNLGSTGVPVHLDGDNKLRYPTLSFDPDGRSIGWADGTAWTVYDRDERDLARKPLHHWSLNAAFRTPDGTRLVSEHTFPAHTLIGWSVTDDGWTQDWSVSTREVSIRRYAVDPNGRRVAVVCQPAGRAATRLDIRSAVSGSVQATGPCPYDQVEQLIFSPDGSHVVAVRHLTLVVWSLTDLAAPRLLRATAWKSRQHFTCVAFHPTGRYLFASSMDEAVHVFDTETWEPLTRFAWKVGPLRSVALGADGLLAAAGNDKGEVVVWDVDL